MGRRTLAIALALCPAAALAHSGHGEVISTHLHSWDGSLFALAGLVVLLLALR